MGISYLRFDVYWHSSYWFLFLYVYSILSWQRIAWLETAIAVYIIWKWFILFKSELRNARLIKTCQAKKSMFELQLWTWHVLEIWLLFSDSFELTKVRQLDIWFHWNQFCSRIFLAQEHRQRNTDTHLFRHQKDSSCWRLKSALSVMHIWTGMTWYKNCHYMYRERSISAVARPWNQLTITWSFLWQTSCDVTQCYLGVTQGQL